MIQYLKKIFLVALLFVATNSFAQSYRKDFSAVDNYVKALGSLDTLNMGTISYIITKKFPDNVDKVRAIFDWITYNINFDVKAAKNNNNDKINSDIILKTRKTTSMGYAALFQDMCSMVKIRCLTVDGYIKNNVEEIGEKPDGFNHTWNVIQLGQSPDTWHYVDPTFGSGYTDDKLTTFTKAYNDFYFFADKTIFNFQHYPDNINWQLGNGVKSLKEFTGMPIVKNSAYDVGLRNFAPATGNIKTKSSKPVQFSIKISDTTTVQIAALLIGTDKKKKTKTVDYTLSGGNLLFSYKFDEEDSYPVTVLINNKPVITYFIEVTE